MDDKADAEEGKEEKNINDYIKIGAVTYRALQKARQAVRVGARLVDAAEEIEKYFRDNGCGLAFPVNLSINEEAAHYTPRADDARTFGEGDIVKVDVGAELNGALSDCAITVDLSGRMGDLVEASKSALENAISLVKAGAMVSKIGGEIDRTIESLGFTPIRNLGGHGIENNDLHAEPFVPNYDDGSDVTLEEGTILSIEPFATDGEGMVVSGDASEIFSFASEVNIRSQSARIIMKEVLERYPKNPFAARWLQKSATSQFSLYTGINELVRAGALEPHPVLVEAKRGMVSQAEAQVLVEKDGCRLLIKEQQ